MAKFRSVKNLLLLWVVITISWIVFGNRADFLPLAQNLAWCVLGYFGANVAQKKIMNERLNH